ncbi:MAG: pilus assembly PilX N-terminal domain-containing protein, partial [Kiritimatiellae bacterium]|nr:pilus assembly PilX N-terminal domain-containing protein [Kiritimatiellia bacterium]
MMRTFIDKDDRRRGAVLMIVMGMMAIGTIAVLSILGSAVGKMRLADKQLSLEQAFYIAQAGAERAATRLADGRTYASDTLSGNFGAGSYVAEVTFNAQSGGEFNVEIISTGTVKGQSRSITMHGVRRASWARYALWYDVADPYNLVISPIEKFSGPVYAKPAFRFSACSGKTGAEFFDRASTGAAECIGISSGKPVFHRGLALNAPLETMASVSFSKLLASAASEGMVLYGPTEIELDGNEMLVTNNEAGWDNVRKPIPANGMLYVGSTTRTTEEWVYNSRRGRYELVTTTTTLKGDVDVSAPQGLDGRMTIVAENNVNITGHIKYANDPRTNPASDDALGLIAQRDIVVEKSAPNNVNIFAHMIAVDGGFGVKDYNSGSSRGMLNVYGGIVNQIRKAVGIVNGAGYDKHYIFDIRFATNPPPNYPKLVDQLEW